MSGAPKKRPELHDRDEPSEIFDLVLGVGAVDLAGKVKELGSLIHFRPKAVLENFLCLFELLVVFEHVEVREDAHDSRESVHLADVEEFENLHLETERSVRQEKNQISHLGDVYHRIDVVGAFDQSHSTLLS